MSVPSSTVQTTLGPLPPSALGRINAHEHLIIDGGYTVVKEPDFRLDSVEKGIEEVTSWREAGGGLIVDTMPFGCGRNVDKLERISRATGVPVLVPSGFQKASYYLPDHWQHRFDAQTIAELLIDELLLGADRNNYDAPIIDRSEVRAAFVKVAGDYQVVTATTRKLILAAGLAHAQTGMPVLVHTEMGTAAEELLDLLEGAGVPPARVMLCHMDRNPDPSLHVRLALRGAYLEYDTPGRIKYQPEPVLLRLMREMIDAGHGDRLLLGGDTARRSYWRAYGGGPGLDYIISVFDQRMRREGFSAAELDAIWHHNPVGWLGLN
ncbi:phosphotriesterase family protein [Deinococcus sp.]|uniref:phosphotriesterase family protein n=1 Tax=Deinococcus sp. TaxID=47478 RepID=UPI003CC6B0A5